MEKYNDLVRQVEEASVNQVTQGFLYYYDTYDKDLKSSVIPQLGSLKLEERKDILKQLCGEVINRDMIYKIRHGVEGQGANEMATILKKE